MNETEQMDDAEEMNDAGTINDNMDDDTDIAIGDDLEDAKG